MKNKLTEKQKKFAKEYLIDFNASRAAKMAGYSEKTANEQGARLLTNVNVQDYIKKYQKIRQEKYEISESRILNELKSIAFSKMSNYADVRNGKVSYKDTEELTDEQLSAIDEISETDKGKIKMKLHDKLRALELLGKHIGMFKDKVKVEGNIEMSEADRKLLENVERRLTNK